MRLSANYNVSWTLYIVFVMWLYYTSAIGLLEALVMRDRQQLFLSVAQPNNIRCGRQPYCQHPGWDFSHKQKKIRKFPPHVSLILGRFFQVDRGKPDLWLVLYVKVPTTTRNFILHPIKWKYLFFFAMFWGKIDIFTHSAILKNINAYTV